MSIEIFPYIIQHIFLWSLLSVKPLDFPRCLLYIEFIKVKKGMTFMKKATKVILSLTLIVLTLVFANMTASAITFDADMQYQTENKVTLYSKKNYKGKSVEYGIGEYSKLDINSDSISVPQEYVVYAYTKKEF